MSLKWLGALVWLVLLVGMPFANRVEPFVLGFPFALAYGVACTLLSAALLALIYALDPANRSADPGDAA